jgi:hypothetical protein
MFPNSKEVRNRATTTETTSTRRRCHSRGRRDRRLGQRRHSSCHFCGAVAKVMGFLDIFGTGGVRVAVDSPYERDNLKKNKMRMLVGYKETKEERCLLTMF